jgi:hypothetical protein
MDRLVRAGAVALLGVLFAVAVNAGTASAAVQPLAAQPLTAGIGGEITGRVTDAQTHLAVEGASVCTRREGESFMAPWTCQSTNANGEYTLGGLITGNYFVWFKPPSGSGYVEQFYDEKATYNEANTASVTQEATTSGIDAALEHPGVAPAALQPVGTPTEPRVTPPVVSLAGSLQHISGALLVSLHCTAMSGLCGSCQVQLTVVEHLSRGRVVAVTAGAKRPRTRLIVIGSARVSSWDAGASKLVRVVLNKTGRRLIARFRRLTVRVSVSSGGKPLMTRDEPIA